MISNVPRLAGLPTSSAGTLVTNIRDVLKVVPTGHRHTGPRPPTAARRSHEMASIPEDGGRAWMYNFKESIRDFRARRSSYGLQR